MLFFEEAVAAVVVGVIIIAGIYFVYLRITGK